MDGALLIDFPADTYMHMLHLGLPLEDIRHCLITHAHSDHFYALDFEMRGPIYAHLAPGQPLHVYGTQTVCDALGGIAEQAKDGEEARIVPHRAEPFVPLSIGAYTVTPLPADHDPASGPVIYRIEDGERALLYAHDTGIPCEDVWKYLAGQGRPLDFVSLDCTCALLPGCKHGHMGLDTCQAVRERMLSEGIAGGHTRFCLNHFSHNGRATYDELLPVAQAAGFEVSYDGMCVEF